MALTIRPRFERPAGYRSKPERIVLGVAERTTPSAKPPVRIFIGTEPGQHRAERVLIWSIEQVRDPSRVYEIHLMKDLVGFDRRRWLTGFTNYRFAIPHFAGGTGRAIYNDVDQMYLADPAELFDLDLHDHGFLAISPRDTSVMLMDCERMAPLWTIAAARRERRKPMEARARAFWGQLERAWNSRDWEYVRGQSKVLHFTTIHTQPWQPFPSQFVYQDNPVGEVWKELERSADAAGYQAFSLHRPSQGYLEAAQRRRSHPQREMEPPAAPPGDIGAVLRSANARDALHFSFGSNHLAAELAGLSVTRYDPVANPDTPPPASAFDAVVCSEVLQHVGVANVRWVVQELFNRARRCVIATVTDVPGVEVLPNGNRLERRSEDPFWWYAHFESVGMGRPDIEWCLVLRSGGGRKPEVHVRRGGRRSGSPLVWVLADEKAGHTTQSVGVAEALGWPYELKQLRFNGMYRLSNRLLGSSRLALDAEHSAVLAPPWPDLVIATGRKTAAIARWIGKQSRGHTRLVQLGRKGGDQVEPFDLVVTCAHFRLPSNPRRVETIAPISQVNAARLAEAGARWQRLFENAPKPRVVLVVGGDTAQHRLEAATARRLGEEVARWAHAAGGAVFAITSPRTSAEAASAVESALGPADHVHRWQRGEKDNPYLGFLACADALVVTGESESMLGEAVATGKPVYIFPLPERPKSPRLRWSEWVTSRAYARPLKKKGTVRPQQGVEYVSARLIERGLVRPPRDLGALHAALIHRGWARPFGAGLETARRSGPGEVEEVASRIRALFGVPRSASEATAERGELRVATR